MSTSFLIFHPSSSNFASYSRSHSASNEKLVWSNKPLQSTRTCPLPLKLALKGTHTFHSFPHFPEGKKQTPRRHNEGLELCTQFPRNCGCLWKTRGKTGLQTFDPTLSIPLEEKPPNGSFSGSSLCLCVRERQGKECSDPPALGDQNSCPGNLHYTAVCDGNFRRWSSVPSFLMDISMCCACACSSAFQPIW